MQVLGVHPSYQSLYNNMVHTLLRIVCIVAFFVVFVGCTFLLLPFCSLFLQNSICCDHPLNIGLVHSQSQNISWTRTEILERLLY